MFRQFSYFTIKTKLTCLFLSTLVMLVLSLTYALLKLDGIGRELKSISADIHITSAVSEITINQLEQAVYFERSLRFGLEIEKHPNAKVSFENSVSSFYNYNDKVSSELKQGEILARELETNARTITEAEEYQHVKKLLIEIEDQHTLYVQHAQAVFLFIEERKYNQAMAKSELLAHEEENLDRSLEVLLLELESFTEAAAKKAEEDEQTAFKYLITIAFFSIITLLSISILISSSITSSLLTALRGAEDIAEGVLNSEIKVMNKGSVGRLEQALLNMRNNLRELVTEMASSSRSLSSAATDLSAISTISNDSIQEQKNKIVQVVASVNELSYSIQEVANNAATTSESAKDAKKEAHGVHQVVQGTIEAIQVLAGGIEDAADAINQVGLDSNAIGKVVDVIKEIAGQTNLLALNAAIEAARAGDKGRGFAVVADEVRSLAQRTQESTAEIEEMISNLQKGAKNAINMMETGRSQVKQSVEHVSQAEFALESITSSVDSINQKNTEIATAAQEQSETSEEINQNISLLSELAEKSSCTVEQTSISTKKLASMALKLQDNISHFKIK